MAAVSILKTLLGWASTAWGAIVGIPGDVSKALTQVWQYVTSVHNLLSWVVGNPIAGLFHAYLGALDRLRHAIAEIADAYVRIPGWIWLWLIRPVRDALNRRIDALTAWTRRQLAILRALVLFLYQLALLYTREQVGIERNQRIAAVRQEHAEMVAAVRAALATVQKEASSGYNSSLQARLGIIGRLVDELGTRNPLVKGLVRDIAGALLDVGEIDNPVVGFLVAKILSEIIDKAGIDQLTGRLAQDLLGPLLGKPRASSLYGVAKDIGERLNTLEGQWAAFMEAGGPEVEQAGREWKETTSVLVDVGLVAFFGLAVSDPAAFAAGVADTIGQVGNGALIAIVDLIDRA